MSEQEIWEKVLEAAKLHISETSMNTFLKDSELYKIENNTAIVLVGYEFYASWLNQKYSAIFESIFSEIMGLDITPKFLTAEQLAEIVSEGDSASKKAPASSKAKAEDEHDAHVGTDQFNTHNTFDTFVIGPGNRFPHAASLAVAEAPAEAYNPLFIYGGVGLGKTHLMHAIGHHVLSNNPNAKVLYTSSEKFTNEFIKSIRDGENEAFRE